MSDLFDTLAEAFPVQPPPNLASLSEDIAGEGDDVTREFIGRRWTDVPEALCRKRWDAPLWFSPEAFVYYAPAFMLHSLRDLEAPEVTNFCSSLVREWHPRTDATLVEIAQERLTRFTDRQLDAWQVWLKELEARKPTFLLEREIPLAREGIRRVRQRRREG